MAQIYMDCSKAEQGWFELKVFSSSDLSDLIIHPYLGIRDSLGGLGTGRQTGFLVFWVCGRLRPLLCNQSYCKVRRSQCLPVGKIVVYHRFLLSHVHTYYWINYDSMSLWSYSTKINDCHLRKKSWKLVGRKTGRKTHCLCVSDWVWSGEKKWWKEKKIMWKVRGIGEGCKFYVGVPFGGD